MPVHKEFDGVAITAKHLGLTGDAWAVWAGWDDQYICMVKGKWANGNAVDGQLCREGADVLARYVVRDNAGKLVRSPHAK